ncbi:MAG: hypothetical protein AAF515_18890 [Pseudomonadota bacterium]
MRESPARLPSSPAFVLLLLIVRFALVLIIANLLAFSERSYLSILTEDLVSTVVAMLLIWMALAARSLGARLLQTLGAYIGMEIVIYLLLGAILAFTGSLNDAPQLLVMLITIWQIAIFAAILHHAMNVPLGLGFAVSIGILTMSVIAGRVAVGA